MSLSGDQIIPANVYDIHVFAIKPNEAGVYEAFIGFNFDENNNFAFVQVRVDKSVIEQLKYIK